MAANVSAFPRSLQYEAERGHARGWCFTRLNGKRPIYDGWQQAPRPSLEQLRQWSKQGNIGLRTGTPSGVVVLDVDTGRGGTIPDGIPETVTVKTGGGGFHLYYSIPEGQTIPQSKDRIARGLEVKSDGGQVVFVGSVHPETGAFYEWMEGYSPDEIALAPFPLELLRRTAPTPGTPTEQPTARGTTSAFERCRKYLEKVPESIQGEAGSDKCFRAACELWRFGLSDGEAAQLLQEYNASKCQPPWSDRELQHKLSDSRARILAAGEFGIRLNANKGTRTDIPQKSAKGLSNSANLIDTGANIVGDDSPLVLSRHFLDRWHTEGPRRTLRYCNSEWFRYTGPCYEVEKPESLRARLYAHIEKLIIEVIDKQTGLATLKPLKPKSRHISDVLDAMPACGPLVNAEMPCWLEGEHRPAAEFIACTNGLLHLPTQTLQASSPDFFSTNAVPFAYDPAAPSPKEWLKFLSSLWGTDENAKAALQEWFGYCLTPDTCQHKIMMLIGPPRSGKGTIARVLTALLGKANVASPTLGGLATQFGAQILLHKTLAIVGDARLSGRTDIAQVVERLLSISGEDLQSVPRKHMPDWVGYLPVRFMLLTNELPRLTDASGALASRFLLLPLEQSFLGTEDHGLHNRLAQDMPGILNWAIAGYDRLKARGRFLQPACGTEALQELSDLGSPVAAFLRDRCRVAPGLSISCATLYQAWRDWCEEQGRDNPGESNIFSRNLKAQASGLRTSSLRTGDGRRERFYNGVNLI